MSLFKNRYRVESSRMPGWDYRWAGWYFVTICTHERAFFFGDVVDGEMRLSGIGEIVAEEWQNTEMVRQGVSLDEWIVMPNHVHGIVVLAGDTRALQGAEASQAESSKSRLKANSLGSILGQFKSAATKRIWAAGFAEFAWQPRFFDRIIRSERALTSVRAYIRNNPANWEADKDNPANLYM